MGITRVSFYPFMIGIVFFLPLDLSFSCWFFFLFRQLSCVSSGYIGIHHLPGFPHFHEQSAGAWICLACIASWLTRNHLISALKFAWSGKKNMDMDEPMSLFAAFFFLDLGLFWWPLHPAGYPLAVSFAIDYFWFPFLISWSLKSIILKLRGIRDYQQAVPFFFGSILGDFVVGSLWMVFGMLAQQHVYTIFI